MTTHHTPLLESSPIRLGLIGAAGRGGGLGRIASRLGYHIVAVCDIDAARLEAAQKHYPGSYAFADYQKLLDSDRVDAVIVGTPMPFHAEQAIAALQRNIHVMSEVPAAVSLEQCQQLVAAAGRSKAVYMMAENYIYLKTNMFVTGLVRSGLFGEVYYAEGEYIHELKDLFEQTTWRRKWQAGTHGVTYPTHSLGPILQWFRDDRVVKVCCRESGSHYVDPRYEPYACDTAVMLAQTEKGRLIKIRFDLVSDRPHAMTNYQLQGTDGAYESSRGGPGDRSKLWLRSLTTAKDRWLDLESLMDQPTFAQYLPVGWRESALTKNIDLMDHGGGDYFVLEDFARTVRREIPCPIDIHHAMDMTLPGLMSEQSVLTGDWIDVPDSRQWCATPGR